MQHRKKKHLSDWAVGMLLLSIRRGDITRKQADIFESVFVRGAKVRKGREHRGAPMLGPGGEVIVIDGVEYCGGEADHLTAARARMSLEELLQSDEFGTWSAANLKGTVAGWGFDEERPDSPDVQAPTGGDQNKAVKKKTGSKRKRATVQGDDDDKGTTGNAAGITATEGEEPKALEELEEVAAVAEDTANCDSDNGGDGAEAEDDIEDEAVDEGVELNAAGFPTHGWKGPEVVEKIKLMVAGEMVDDRAAQGGAGKGTGGRPAGTGGGKKKQAGRGKGKRAGDGDDDEYSPVKRRR